MNTSVIIFCLHQITITNWMIMVRLKIILILDTYFLCQNKTCISSPISHLPTPISLHKLYEPNPVPFHFETPGWYILFSLILVTTIFLLIGQILKFKKNKYRRAAINDIENLKTDNSLIPELFVILKRTAIHAFGREKTGNLYGKEWISFLEKSGKNINLSAYSEEISDILYQGKPLKTETELKILLNAKKWVKTHACKF